MVVPAQNQYCKCRSVTEFGQGIPLDQISHILRVTLGSDPSVTSLKPVGLLDSTFLPFAPPAICGSVGYYSPSALQTVWIVIYWSDPLGNKVNGFLQRHGSEADLFLLPDIMKHTPMVINVIQPLSANRAIVRLIDNS